MSFETALRLTEIVLAFAIAVQCLEHLRGGAAKRAIFALRLFFAALLASGALPLVAAFGLLATSVRLLYRYDGPYNGGADRMGLLVLFCVTGARLPVPLAFQELAFGYLAAQLVLSYFISGWVKVVNRDWRSGAALQEVFAGTNYPAAEDLRALGGRRGMMRAGAWAVMALELAFPLALMSPWLLIPALIGTAGFHLANALLFGFNRFFWVWLAAYPALLWLQGRLIG